MTLVKLYYIVGFQYDMVEKGTERRVGQGCDDVSEFGIYSILTLSLIMFDDSQFVKDGNLTRLENQNLRKLVF